MWTRAFATRALSTTCLLALLVPALPENALAQAQDPTEARDTRETGQAREHFARGVGLYKEGDFDAALAQFEQAYAVKPSFKVLYNIAQCHFELHQYVEARDTLAQYLRDGALSIDAERKAAVAADLSGLQRRIAHLDLDVDVTSATVFVDGKRAGTTPLPNGLDLSEGQRTISVEAPGRGVTQRVVLLAGGDRQSVTIHFQALPAPAPTAASASPPPGASPAPTGLGKAFWATGIGALALGGAAGVTGYWAISAEREHERQVQRFGATQHQLDDSRARTKSFALATDILAGSAILCAGVATVILLGHDSSHDEVSLAVGPGRLGVQGAF